MSDWASFDNKSSGKGGEEWANFGDFETAAPAPARQQAQQQQQQQSQPGTPVQQPPAGAPWGTVAPPPASVTRRGSNLKPKQPATTSAVPQGSPQANLVGSTNLAIQLQQSKQRLAQLHQQLLMGNQHLKELQKHPNQEQNIAQLQGKLKIGVQQYQQLQQGIQQLTVQLQQQQQQQTQQPSPVQQPQTGQQPAVQATATPATTTTTTTTGLKEQETAADPNAEEDIFAKFEDTPSPAANQALATQNVFETSTEQPLQLQQVAVVKEESLFSSNPSTLSDVASTPP